MKMLRACTYRAKDLKVYQDMMFQLKTRHMSKAIIDRLRTLVIMEMNRTLNSGKLSRISAMDIEFSTKITPVEYYNWTNIIHDIFETPPVFGTATGPQGAGKTHAALWVAEYLAKSGINVASNITFTQGKAKKGWNVQIRNGMDRYTRVRNLSDIFNLEKGTVIFLDESGIHWSKRDATTKKSKNMGKIIRLFRKRGLSLILIDQYYETIPTEFKKLDVFQIKRKKHGKKRVTSIDTPLIHIKIDKLPIHTYQFDTEELPSFTIDFDIDKYFKKEK